MEGALAGTPVRDFVRPTGIVEFEICANSGAQPTEYCPQRRTDIFAEDQPPLDSEHDWYQLVQIDTFSGLLANEFCPDHVTEQVMVVITDPQGREWGQAQGWPLAPLEVCGAGTVQPEVRITSPAPGSSVSGLVPVIGTVVLPNFNRYDVQYGVGDNPQGWGWISGPHLAQVRDGQLAVWDTTNLSPGVYTLRVTAWDSEGRSVEGWTRCAVAAPTEPPTLTPLPTDTPLPTALPTLTPPPPTATPEPPTSVPPTNTPVPTEPPTPVPTTPPSPSPSPSPPPTETPTTAPSVEPSPTP
jgi:hypothetical protein